jgi:hypothetical protein
LNTGIPVQLARHLGDLLVVDLRDDVEVTVLPLLLPLRLLAEQLLLVVPQLRGTLEVLRVYRALLLTAHVGDLLVELTQVRRRGHATDAHPGAGLVDQVDRLVRQEPVVDVPVARVAAATSAGSVIVTRWCAS